MDSIREGDRQRSRVLYVFRTPPDVRVGSSPLEPVVMRELETLYPNIEFDWKALVSSRQTIESVPRQDYEKKRQSTERLSNKALALAKKPNDTKLSLEALLLKELSGSISDMDTQQWVAPSAIEGTTIDEQLAWLQLWYPQIRDFVLQRIQDTEDRKILLGLAEFLNSKPWTDQGSKVYGLEAAAEVMGRLSQIFTVSRHGKSLAVQSGLTNDINT